LCVFLSTIVAGQKTTDPAHASCSWCHSESGSAESSRAVATGSGKPSPTAARMCLSCHDGLSAELPDDGHLNHAPTKTRAGLDCLVCHSPHDRTGSYRLLRSKVGPQTPQTAVLAFCRECHTDH